ncbi:MAG: response regulator transcription factor [Kiritimatiellae bacterium]|nr:response regulator transcription factor [Kiritimatiellia bacterium]MDD5520576.1 response regulator transcription factor [Kiritimatiellia bacterium]
MSTKKIKTERRILRVLIVDDHPMIRKGLSDLLRENFVKVDIGEASSSQEALDQIWKHTWDLILLDVSLPGRSGLEILKDIRKDRPVLPVLVLSVHEEEEYALRVLKSGANGYIMKNKASDELVGAINKVLSGGRYVSSSMTESLMAHVAGVETEEFHKNLSDREYEVFSLIASGKSVSEIAGKISLSVKTISTYRSRILEKMNMRSNAELVRYAVSKGLVS